MGNTYADLPPGLGLNIGDHPGANPGARAVRDVLGHIEVYEYRVSYQASDQWDDDRFPWQVRGPGDADGMRDVLDEFASYREAVADAKRRHKEGK